MAGSELAPGDRVRLRDASSWWIDHANGAVTLVVSRRVGAAEGSWNFVRCPGATEAEALAVYDDYCLAGLERSTRQHERRQRWGPLEVRR